MNTILVWGNSTSKGEERNYSSLSLLLSQRPGNPVEVSFDCLYVPSEKSPGRAHKGR